MVKKLVFTLMAALLLAASFSGKALAAEGDHPGLVQARGEVVSLDYAAGKFRIEKSDGSTLTFFADEETSFRGQAGSLEELQVGWKVGVAAEEREGGKLWAVLVISGDPEDFLKARGIVADLNISAGKFSLEKPDGESLTFFVDQATRYGGQLQGLEDLQEGWGAAVVAVEATPGKLVAVGLVAGDGSNLVKSRGAVTAVDPEAGKFEIETPDGERLGFFVDQNTRYRGQLGGLDEIELGWQAGVAAREGEDGKLTAVLVIAGIRPETVRAQGLIVGVDAAAGKFRLEKPDGSVLTLIVDQNTRYRGQVEGIADLQEGLRAAVAAVEDQSGNLTARLVAAGEIPAEGPEIVKARGIIHNLSPGAGKFQLEKADGSIVTVYVDSRTAYRGGAASFADLEKGQRAGFAGYLDQDGNVIARIVFAGSPLPGRRSESPEYLRPGGELPGPESDLPLEPLL